MDLSRIDTEKVNPETARIDEEDSLGIVSLMNAQDALVAEAVKKELPQIAKAVDMIVRQLERGGRLIYQGSGTSGRLGVLDAVECPPTFGVDSGLVVGLISGGPNAFVKAVEGAEDDREAGATDLKALKLNEKDALVGIAASGRTPYVLGGMEYALSQGAAVIGLACTSGAALREFAQVMIAPLCGPEAITGSTRLKSGTAQKMVLNMLSTAAMVRLGKVYGNLMVDVKATNAKLRQRAVNILTRATGIGEEEAKHALEQAGGSCKIAIVSVKTGLNRADTEALLIKARGRVAEALRLFGL